MKVTRITYRGVNCDDFGNIICNSADFAADEVDIRIVDNCLIVWDSTTGKLKFMTPLNRVICCEEVKKDE